MNIISRVYDGMQFFFTKEAIESRRKIIGFCFDDLGLPHPIERDSLYGQHIQKWILSSNTPCGC